MMHHKEIDVAWVRRCPYTYYRVGLKGLLSILVVIAEFVVEEGEFGNIYGLR